MNRVLLRYGFILVGLSLLTGALVPAVALPRLGLSAHTIGMIGGLLLIAVGAIWPAFSLGDSAARALQHGWVYAVYSNWLGCLVGAVTGAGRATPLAAGGQTGAAPAELTVLFLLASGSIIAVVATGLSLWGLRSR